MGPLQFIHAGNAGGAVHAVLPPEPLLEGLPHVGQNLVPVLIGHGKHPALPLGQLGVVQ